MIELIPDELDDAGFLSVVQRIINGAVAELGVHEVFVVQIDNWFDHKWLGWRTRRGDRELRIPMFSPGRVRSERHFHWDEGKSAWKATEMARHLHVRKPGRPWLAERLSRFSETAAFIWYSGNSAANKEGSLMFYLAGAEGYSWYLSFGKGNERTIDDEVHITRRELLSFELRGNQLELLHAQLKTDTSSHS
jgi:hypothetical protein